MAVDLPAPGGPVRMLHGTLVVSAAISLECYVPLASFGLVALTTPAATVLCTAGGRLGWLHSATAGGSYVFTAATCASSSAEMVSLTV